MCAFIHTLSNRNRPYAATLFLPITSCVGGGSAPVPVGLTVLFFQWLTHSHLQMCRSSWTCLLSKVFCSPSAFCCRCAIFQSEKNALTFFLRTHHWEKTKRNHISWFFDLFVKKNKVNLHSRFFVVLIHPTPPHPLSHAVVTYHLRVKDTCLWGNWDLSLVVTPSLINFLTLDTLFLSCLSSHFFVYEIRLTIATWKCYKE